MEILGLLLLETIVQSILAFILNLIAVMPQLLEMKIFVHLKVLVEKMKDIVTQMMNDRMALVVAQTIVQVLLVWTLELIVVIHALAPMVILTGKVINIVMMRTTIVDVNGMEGTVVVIMLTQSGVQLVNV